MACISDMLCDGCSVVRVTLVVRAPKGCRHRLCSCSALAACISCMDRIMLTAVWACMVCCCILCVYLQLLLACLVTACTTTCQPIVVLHAWLRLVTEWPPQAWVACLWRRFGLSGVIMHTTCKRDACGAGVRWWRLHHLQDRLLVFWCCVAVHGLCSLQLGHLWVSRCGWLVVPPLGSWQL
jgi:hypothetical protein